LTESETAALAEEYVLKAVSKEEALRIQQRVRSLDQETMRLFHRKVLELGSPTPEQRVLAETSLDYALSKGISFIDLRNDDLREVMARTYGVSLDQIPLDLDGGLEHRDQPGVQTNLKEKVASVQQAACWPWEWSCGSTSAWNSAVGKTICSGNCTAGSGWDNTGNSPCEVGGCDTRVWFPRASASFIDGVTAGADCVITWYTSLSKYSASGFTYVGYGVAGPAACAFFPANPAAHFQVR
jgi:hypothetical protein